MTNTSRELKTATANYIEEMLVELRSMGKKIDSDFLVYLLEMAMLEAGNIKRNLETPARIQSVRSAEDEKISAEQLATIYMSGNID